MNIRDTLERLVWTFIAGALGAVIGAPLLDLELWQAAAVSGLGDVVALVLIIARRRLSILPDPGAGLPGLPTNPQEN